MITLRKKLWILIIFLLLMFSSGIVYLSNPFEKKPSLSPYPFGRNFAFTITDDPDFHRLEKIKPVYELLGKLGMKTTIAVWIKEAKRSNGMPNNKGVFDYGDTIERKSYRDYILELQERGFEIALHTVSGGNDLREDTLEGYEDFKAVFGVYPKINIMHSNNLENVYWGPKVFKSDVMSWIFRDLIGLVYKKARIPFEGEDSDSPYFWGDILREKTKYVRLWGTSDINTLNFNPSMPYHDPEKPFVNYWFSFSDGYDLSFFNRLVSDKNINTLVEERGASIVYTHFSNFSKRTRNGSYEVDEYFRNQVEKIAKQKDGWFVPTSILLDRLLAMKNVNLFTTDTAFIVVNSNTYTVEGITLLVLTNLSLYDPSGKSYVPNREGEVVIERLGPGESITLFKQKGSSFLKNNYPGMWEYFNLALHRSLILLFSHSG